MTTTTHKVDDVKLNIIFTELGARYISVVQGEDVIVLSMSQARKMIVIMNEA